jgi:hypothetical protein
LAAKEEKYGYGERQQRPRPERFRQFSLLLEQYRPNSKRQNIPSHYFSFLRLKPAPK